MPSNSELKRPWLWRCPHCLGENVTLESALRHMRRRHLDCFSCRLEQQMVIELLADHGIFFEGRNSEADNRQSRRVHVVPHEEIEWMN